MAEIWRKANMKFNNFSQKKSAVGCIDSIFGLLAFYNPFLTMGCLTRVGFKGYS